MIWDFALTTPQTHILWDTIISQSKINLVMQSCTEAQDRGLKLQLPFFQSGHDDVLGPSAKLPKHYINLDIDTIWIESAFLPENLTIYCNRCNREWNRGIGCCNVNSRLFCVAINRSAWEDAIVKADGRGDVGTTDILRITNAKELVIIMGDVLPPKDTVLIQPRDNPWVMLPELGFAETTDRRHKTIRNSWKLAEKRLE